MRPLVGIALIGLLALGACAPTASGIVAGGAAATPATTVATITQGLAKLTDADLKAAMAELVATGTATGATAAPPFEDDYQCLSWLDAQLPTWMAQLGGLVPARPPAGPVSAFIALKITAVNAKGTVTGQPPAQFAHYCGAAISDDTSAATALLAKVGVTVALPGGSGLFSTLGL